jgi:predicted nucleic acid-binding protein
VNVLVDTSVWSLAYRRSATALNPQQRTLLNSLEEIASDGRAQLLGMVRQEMLSGLRETSQFERLRKLLQAFPNVRLETEDHEEAARINYICRAKGITGNIVDYLICATAARRGWSIFTLDQDFDCYAKHVPIRLFKVSS